MDERQGPFWVYGSGTLALAVSSAPETTSARLWVDGEVVEGPGPSQRSLATSSTASAGTRSCWRSRSCSTRSRPRGLRLVRLAARVAPGGPRAPCEPSRRRAELPCSWNRRLDALQDE